MLFLFQGKHGPLVRSVIGAVVVVVGLLLFHRNWLIAAIGSVLVIWGAVGVLTERRGRRRQARRDAEHES